MALKKLSDERLVFSMPLSYKILSSFIALVFFILILFFSSNSPDEALLSNIVPFIIFLVSVLSALYHEKWIFDKKSNCITYQFGLVFLYKSKLFKFQDIRHLELIQSTKGKEEKVLNNSTKFSSKRINLLALRMKDDKLLKIEFYGSNLKMEPVAISIAAHCSLSIVSA